jgi:DNA-binding transcriptional LysR family regulator
MKDNIRKIDLNLLLTLKVLLEERNVSRSAERLALTQPTVSGMLTRLRVLFDDPLFVRTQHGVVPTPKAESLAPALDQLLRDANALVDSDEFDPLQAAMDFRISVNDYMQSTLILPLIKELRGSAPNMKLAIRNMEVDQLSRQLALGDLDLAITLPEYLDQGLHSRQLYSEKYVCAVRDCHPIRASKVSLKRFLQYDHVLVSPSDGMFKGPADEMLARQNAERRVAYSVPSFLVLLEVLQLDDFIALVPERFLRGRAHPLRVIQAPIEMNQFEVLAAWHPRSHNDKAHRWLREKLSNIASIG